MFRVTVLVFLSVRNLKIKAKELKKGAVYQGEVTVEEMASEETQFRRNYHRRQCQNVQGCSKDFYARFFRTPVSGDFFPAKELLGDLMWTEHLVIQNANRMQRDVSGKPYEMQDLTTNNCILFLLQSREL